MLHERKELHEDLALLGITVNFEKNKATPAQPDKEQVRGRYVWPTRKPRFFYEDRLDEAAGPKTIANDMLERIASFGNTEEIWKWVGYSLDAPGMDSVRLGLEKLDDIYDRIYRAWRERDFEAMKRGFEDYAAAAPEGSYETLLAKRRERLKNGGRISEL